MSSICIVLLQVTSIHGLQMASPSAAASASLAGSGIHDSPTAGSNPIGSLQEMCVKNNWTPPSYDLVHESGEAHTKTFIMECKVPKLECLLLLSNTIESQLKGLG